MIDRLIDCFLPHYGFSATRTGLFPVRGVDWQGDPTLARHLLDLFELAPQDAQEILRIASKLKRERREGQSPILLPGRTLGLIFEKPSMRTRVSFETAIAQLGGNALFMRNDEIGLGVRECIEDFARVISQYLDALAVRTHKHKLVEDLAKHAEIPIINALSEDAHPCQALADMMTIEEEFGRLQDIKLAFVGDGNNVARSLAVASALLGVDFVLACPTDYDFPNEFVQAFSKAFGFSPQSTHDPYAALRDADVAYTDVWTSMGQEAETQARLEAFAAYQINADLFRVAKPNAIIMHCMPAHRGEEITAEVIDGSRSRIIPQAANRLHLQKGLLVDLIATS